MNLKIAFNAKLASLSPTPDTAESMLLALMRESSLALTDKLPAVVVTLPVSPSMKALVRLLTKLLDSTKPIASPPLDSPLAPDARLLTVKGESASELVSLLTRERM